ncbi:hypothetical protein HF520_10600 [Romboutsia sp. CE17]|nr:hypothetical protein HF520_10600 [Romboutsia sp. CE17]
MIRNAFRNDYKVLAKTYRISEGHIRRIIKEIKSYKIKKIDIKLQ